MRCYILLAAAAALFASTDVLAIPSHAGVPKLDLTDESWSASTVQKTNVRLLRTHQDANEDRTVTLNARMILDDLTNSEKAVSLLEKSVESANKRRALFDAMFLDQNFRKQALRQMVEGKGPIKSIWNAYLFQKAAKYEKNEIAAARRGTK
ncbi:unnamed protein product [Phytophthora fragariaefolia]|uniref:RxLR effector protein n=1 Tax=Phytophthora fragariaefolia TaxID=1490495 RepID=A0A9W6TPD2_9STRA|nr:unnamed protein product [Phytophthora fragariaefolia]